MLISQFPKKLLSNLPYTRCLTTVSFGLRCNIPYNTSIKSKERCLKNKFALLQTNSSFVKIQYKLFSKDLIDKELGKLLYVGKLEAKFKWVLGIYYTLSVAAAVCAPFLLTLASKSVITLIFTSIHLFIFIIINPILLFQFGKRYVNKLYFNAANNQYTAFLLSPTVVKEKRLVFKARDCKMPVTPSVFTSFYVGKDPLFINSNEMNYNDYMELLRYAEDLDFENPDRQKQFQKSVEAAVEQKQAEDEKKKN